MKILFVSDSFSKSMGYIVNCLPMSLSKRGHEVHLICSTGNVYFRDTAAYKSLEKHLGPSIVDKGVEEIDGVIVHRVDYGLFLNRIYLKGLIPLILSIKPDVINTFDITQPYLLQTALAAKKIGVPYFSGCHETVSNFRLSGQWDKFSLHKLMYLSFKTWPGKFIMSPLTYLNYPVTIDCLKVATKYMGMKMDKCKVVPLGVNTHYFKPVRTDDEILKRTSFRSSLGYLDKEIVCIYTGKFIEMKKPVLLARAIDRLNSQGYNYKAIFLGAGPQVEEISQYESSQVIGFKPYHELSAYYQAADIGVWPAQESMSMMDAAACGIPVIVNHTVQALERVQGNGLMYELDNIDDLCQKLLELHSDLRRKQLGDFGAKKMHEQFSWGKIAKDREQDYLEAIELINC